MLRRSDPDNVPLTDILILAGGDLKIDTPVHRITWQKHHLNFTPTVFNMLLYLARHPGRVFTRTS